MAGGSAQHRLDRLLVAGTATEVAGKRIAHLALGGIWILPQEGKGGEKHTGRAEAALYGADLDKCLLQWVKLPGRRQPIHRCKCAAIDLRSQHRAARTRHTIDQHRAGPTFARAAAVPDLAIPFAAQQRQERLAGRYIQAFNDAIDTQFEFHICYTLFPDETIPRHRDTLIASSRAR